MSKADEPDVKDVETVHIAPASADDEDVEDETEDTEPESSQEETEGDDESAESEDETEEDGPDTEDTTTTDDKKPIVGDDGLTEIEGETPRERALRSELTKTRDKLRKEQSEDLFNGNRTQAPVKKEMSPERKATLAKYDPKEIDALREVIPALAEEMGFVRKDELSSNNFEEKSQDVLDTFLEKHPEYLPENDKDGSLWKAFGTEFSQYKTPTNPKDFARIFEKVHRDVLGIKPAGALQTKVKAQQEKTKVASHSGTSPAAPASRKAVKATGGLRTDMLKGFSQEEIDEMTSDDEDDE